MKCNKGKKERCCPDFCDRRTNKYHEIYCCNSEKCGEGKCGNCKCAMISLAVTANPTVVSLVGQSINFSYTITNEGSVDLCHPILICSSKIGKIELTHKRDTFIPVNRSITVNRSYVVTEDDFRCPEIKETSIAYQKVDMRDEYDKCGNCIKVSHGVHSEKVCSFITAGGADVFGDLTLAPVPIVAGDVTATLTIGNLADSVAVAEDVELFLRYPVGLTEADVTLTPDPQPGFEKTAQGLRVFASTLAIGESRVFGFTFPIADGQSFAWSGVVKSRTHDANQLNNRVFALAALPPAAGP